MAGSIEKVINVNIKDNAAEVEKEFKKLNKTLDDTEEKVIDVNSSFEDVYNDLKPLTGRLGEAEDRLYELALAGKQNTQEYKELLQATANYRQVQLQTDLVVDTAAQTMSQKLGGALEGAASGFALVQGAMGLFGTESEEVEKALLKVQSAMALAQGIEGVRTALPLFKSFGGVIKNAVVGAFTTLRGAIISTGIGALVVALGMAADAMGLFGGATEDAAEANEKLAESIAKNTSEIERRIGRSLKQLELQRKEAEAYGATEVELFEMRKKAIDEEERLRTAQYEANLKRIEKLKNNKSDEVKSEVENLKKQNTALFDSLYNRIQGENDYDLQRRELELEYQAFKNKQTDEEIKKAEELKQKRIEKAEQTRLALEEQERQRILNIQQLEQDFLAELEGVESEYFDSLLSEQEQEVRAVEDKYFRLLELAEQYKVDSTTLEAARAAELKAINDKYKEDDVVTTEETEDSKIDIKAQAASNVLNILSLLTSVGNEESKKTFELQKAVGLAQATIDTYKGAASAYANTVGGPVIKGIAAGVAVAAGLANVKKIASTKFNAGTSNISASNVSTPSTPNATQQLATPNFNVVGASGVSQAESLAPVKAYVVSGDVTTAQALDRNRINNATF
jgi:hypothetical protein